MGFLVNSLLIRAIIVFEEILDASKENTIDYTKIGTISRDFYVQSHLCVSSKNNDIGRRIGCFFRPCILD